LTKDETQEYIFHRLKLVSLNGCDIFSPEAMDLIYLGSSGIPRLINLICDSALLSGYIYETKKITEKIITEVVKERDFNQAVDEKRLYPANEGTVHAGDCT
jgi:general secretion pathway protein A